VEFSLYNLADPLRNTIFFLSLFSLPRQILGASSTHVFCNQQGRIILRNDGHERKARLVNQFSNELDKGVIWADKGWRSMTHHYDPETGRGIWLWADAAQKCAAYFKKAFSLWQHGKHAGAMFLVGAAAHLVQDACVPHHASCRMGNGHLAYENWVEKNKHQYKVQAGGLYDQGDTPPQEWIITNARLAGKHYSRIQVPGNNDHYHQVTSVLLPLAQRSTAGFFNFCSTRFLHESPLHF